MRARLFPDGRKRALFRLSGKSLSQIPPREQHSRPIPARSHALSTSSTSISSRERQRSYPFRHRCCHDGTMPSHPLGHSDPESARFSGYPSMRAQEGPKRTRDGPPCRKCLRCGTSPSPPTWRNACLTRLMSSPNDVHPRRSMTCPLFPAGISKVFSRPTRTRS